MLQGKCGKWKGYIRKIVMTGLMVVIILPNMLINPTSEVFAEEADYDFLVVGETVTIVEYLGTDTDVTIPEQIQGKDVTVINDFAFIGKKISKVTIPRTVTTIGVAAFMGCELNSIILNEGLTEIGMMAFAGNRMNHVDIPWTVAIIEAGAFSQGDLSTLTLREGLVAIGDEAFWDNELKSVTIPEGVTTIGEKAFIDNKLEEVTLPSTITSIGSQAFIGESAFKNNLLESVRIPGSMSVIEKEAFKGNVIKTIILNEGLEEISEQAFEGNKMEEVVFPSTVNYIAMGAFSQNEINTLSLPSGVGAIGEFAFFHNPLTEVHVYNVDLVFGDLSFFSETYTTPEDLTLFGRSGSTTEQYATFYGFAFQVLEESGSAVCGEGTDFECVVNDDDTITITGYTGSDTDVLIPNMIDGKYVTAIGEEAFLGKQLITVELPFGVTIIEKQAFSANHLTSVIIINDRASIEGSAFEGNQSNPEDLTIYGCFGSTAEAHANDKGYSFEESTKAECLGMNLTPSKTDPTNRDVTIFVNVNKLPESITELKWVKGDQNLTYFQVGGGEVVVSNEFIVVENDTYTVYVKDVLGRELIASIQINNIDKTPPVVTGVTDGEVYDAPVTINFNEGVATLNGLASTSGTTVEVNGEYELIVTDEAGNETAVIFEMKQSDYIYVNTGSGTVRITGYRGTDTNIEIPNTLDGQTVTAIGNYAFSEKNLESVGIPDSVTGIGEYAFYKNRIEEIEIPGSVTTIGNHAFRDNHLASVTFSDGLERIGINAFTNNHITELNIPNTVTLIDYGAFVNNYITELTLGENVQTIADFAFLFSSLQEITIPESVTYIGRGAFRSVQMESFIVLSSEVILNPNVFHDEAPANPEQLTIQGYCGSTANALATQWGYSFEQIETDECLMIGLIPSETDLTNEEVTVFIDVISDIADVVELKWATGSKDLVDFRNGDGEDMTDNQFTVSENGTYTAYVKDKIGNEKVQRIEINNIDKSLLIIHVQIEDGETITLHTYGSDSIQQLKQKIQDAKGIATEKQKITFGGSVLEDGRTLVDYNIPNQTTLQLVILSSNVTPTQIGGVYIPSSDTRLARLEVNVDGENILPFDPAQFKYDLGHTEAESVEIIVKTHHPKAKIILNGEAFVDRQTLLLNKGKNTFEIVIFAENGDKQAYTITLNRLEKVPFFDIAEHWAQSYIKQTYWGKLFYGYLDQTFRPDEPISRMEVTSVVVRLLELDEQKQVPFTDIELIGKDVMWELEKAYANGVVKGYSDQTFKPYADVTRAHLALIFYRTYERINGTPYKPIQSVYFPDIAEYDLETQNAIAMLVELNIAEGSDGKFMPNEQATRAQVAKMLVNFKEVLGRLENK